MTNSGRNGDFWVALGTIGRRMQTADGGWNGGFWVAPAKVPTKRGFWHQKSELLILLLS